MTVTRLTAGSLRERLGIMNRAKVMMLGCFHFDYPNQDFHVPANQIDILSEQRQAEVEEVVRLLAEFGPTKIAIERRSERAVEVQEQYAAYLAGNFDLPRGEYYQIGFRLAKQLGHERLYGIDAEGRHYEAWENYEAYVRNRFGQGDPQVSEEELWYRMHEPAFSDFMTVLKEIDQHLAASSLRNHLLLLNSPEYLEVSHGPYLSWVDSEPEDFTLVDMQMGWYNRNLRIFANLKRITESPDDRILVIFGVGHTPILRHAIQSSPFHEWVDVTTYLNAEP